MIKLSDVVTVVTAPLRDEGDDKVDLIYVRRSHCDEWVIHWPKNRCAVLYCACFMGRQAGCNWDPLIYWPRCTSHPVTSHPTPSLLSYSVAAKRPPEYYLRQYHSGFFV